MAQRPLVVIGLLGSTIDVGRHPDRWKTWRPSVALCRQPDLIVNCFELLHSPRDKSLASVVSRDIASVSPETSVQLHPIECARACGVSGALAVFTRVALGFGGEEGQGFGILHANQAGDDVPAVALLEGHAGDGACARQELCEFGEGRRGGGGAGE